MPPALNDDIAGRLDEVAQLLSEQQANHFRVQAYQRAAAELRRLERPVSEIFAADGLAGLDRLPGVGPSIARAIRDLLRQGRLGILDRLRGDHDPIALLMTVPGIGKAMAWKVHDTLGIESLEALETAAHDGRLATIAGFGPKRLAGIRDTLAHRLGRVRPPPAAASHGVEHADTPSVAELLDVDAEYRREAAAGRLRTIAPRRFNPSGAAWLPVLHTTRGDRHYTALFSNTARAHELGKTGDWVVLYWDGPSGEHQGTVITAAYGRLAGHRVVRGREAECEALHTASPQR